MRNERLSEAEFLRKEAEIAKAAIAKTLEELKADLQQAADLKMWTQKHPWAAVGVASLAGFLAASAVVPPKQDGNVPQAHAPRVDREEDRHPKQPPQRFAAMSGALNWLMVPLFDVAKRSLEHYVNSIVASSGNGHERPEEEPDTHPTAQTEPSMA